jgi:hypothetical protein
MKILYKFVMYFHIRDIQYIKHCHFSAILKNKVNTMTKAQNPKKAQVHFQTCPLMYSLIA